MAFGIAPPPMGTVVRNLGQAAEFVYDHEWLRIADYSAGSMVQHARLFSSSGGPLIRSRLNPAFATLGTTGDRAVPYTTTLRENAWPIATKHFAQDLKGQARMRSTCPAIASGPTSGRARKDVERRASLARRLTPSACRSTPHSPGAPEPARECSQVLGRCRDPGALGARRAQ